MSKLYRLRLTYQDDDQFYRLIDIPADASLEELHLTLLASIGFDQSQLASLFLSDEQWQKGAEFTLMDMGENPEEAETFLMHRSSLHEVMGREQNRMVYVYDYAIMWTFYLELVDILSPQPDLEYPVVVEEAGEMPVQSKARGADDLSPLNADDLELIRQMEEKNHQQMLGQETDDSENDEESEGSSDDHLYSNGYSSRNGLDPFN